MFGWLSKNLSCEGSSIRTTALEDGLPPGLNLLDQTPFSPRLHSQPPVFHSLRPPNTDCLILGFASHVGFFEKNFFSGPCARCLNIARGLGFKWSQYSWMEILMELQEDLMPALTVLFPNPLDPHLLDERIWYQRTEFYPIML
ncbi:hypothetical protein MTP99_002688 [Tenebrio molitor]|nr:hypothetical protein MTP99_002688 [Tenebrio molitor]